VGEHAALNPQPTYGEPAASLLRAYRDLLADATQRFNLTSLREPEAIERRHIGESLAVARALAAAGVLPPGSRVIDVGSGGGLPGIPIAIARPDVAVTLLEATGKKAAFLQEAVTALGLRNARVLAARAEEAAHRPAERETYDLAIARAVAPLAALVELALPFVRIGGALAAVKGSRVEQEIEDAAAAIRACGGGPARKLGLDTGEPNLCLVIIPKVAGTPAHLPRRPGLPVKRPLR
jgi:16S rRNA (guanine527-N7)-methyltransferase